MDNFDIEDLLPIGDIIINEIDEVEGESLTVGAVNVVNTPDFHGGG